MDSQYAVVRTSASLMERMERVSSVVLPAYEATYDTNHDSGARSHHDDRVHRGGHAWACGDGSSAKDKRIRNKRVRMVVRTVLHLA